METINNLAEMLHLKIFYYPFLISIIIEIVKLGRRAFFLPILILFSTSPEAKIDPSTYLRTPTLCLTYSTPLKGSRCDIAKSCYENGLNYLKKIESSLGKNIKFTDKIKKIRLHQSKANVYIWKEESIYKAVLEMEKAVRLAKELDHHLYINLLLELGSLQMRLGEIKNCIENHNRDSCIFPLTKNAEHKNKDGSRAAIKTFMKYLEYRPNDDQVVFLLNLMHQTLGQYPHLVPKRYLLKEKLFKSKTPFPRFPNIAGDIGLQSYKQEAGAAVLEDFNNDGYLDVMLSSLGFCDPIVYFQNNGDGSFTDKSIYSGLSNITNNTTILPADYDNDGLLDIYLSHGGWESDIHLQKLGENFNKLMKNLGNGKFKDVTEEVGLKTKRNQNLASLWVDINNDGQIDLFVCNEFREPELFINNNGKFKNALGPSNQIGINNKRCKSAVFGDFNNDGWQDLWLSYYYDRNFLYLNNKDGTFKDVTPPKLKNHQASFVAWFFDYDNDGNLDLFLAVFPKEEIKYSQYLRGKSPPGETLKIFKNIDGKSFKDMTKSLNLDKIIFTMGANYGDLNNDGYLDFYLGTGRSKIYEVEPNRMFLNQEGKKFVDVTYAGGFGNIQKGHGISFGDIDNDGDQDVLAQFGGAFPGDAFYPSLFQNPGHGNNWVTLRLTGVKANRSAIGSRVEVTIIESGKQRKIHRMVSSGGTFGSNSLQLEIGLGKAERIVELKITWAGSLTRQSFKRVPINKILSIKEFDKEPILMDQKLVKFKLKDGSHRHHMKH